MTLPDLSAKYRGLVGQMERGPVATPADNWPMAKSAAAATARPTAALVDLTLQAIVAVKTNVQDFILAGVTFMTKNVYLAGGVRTAIGSFGGAFETAPAPALGSAVVVGG